LDAANRSEGNLETSLYTSEREKKEKKRRRKEKNLMCMWGYFFPHHMTIDALCYMQFSLYFLKA
jgi:hypothetical protein